MMKSITLFFTFLCFISITKAQVYEDFESGGKLSWTIFNGQAFSTVANPDKSGINTSENVGKLDNDGVGDFNFILAEFAAPADLSKNNLLRMKVWSPIVTKVLLKYEGPGQAVEKFIDLTETNKWVELKFDLSGGAGLLNLRKVLIAINPFTTPSAQTFYIDDIVGTEAKDTYETFETGNEMGWLGLDGVLEAPVGNPAPNSVNNSENCGKYTKSDKHSYSLLLADRGTNPFDLSLNNQFKLQVHASAPTQVLFKLEGPGGPAIEKIANIGLRDAWQEYSFDFSDAKDYKHLTKAIIFFDPGVETSADVYYFDNLTAVPKGGCTASNPLVIDDFECNRNATYVNGWDSLSVVTNPAPGGANTSSKVGKYVDPQGEEWAALLMDYQNPIDLSTNNQLKAKIHCPRATRILFKLEGGASPAVEVPVDVTEAGSWVQYEVDFSNQAIASHKKIVLFFNAGTLPQAGDTYYIDDIQWAEKTSKNLEDFENGAVLPWAPLDDLTDIHGTFAVADNPSKTAPNESNKVGKYTKGNSAFSTLAAVAPSAIDISKKPQYNLDVWTPVGSKNVTFQLESAASGNKEVTRNLKNPGNWETLSFDFSKDQSISDWISMRLLFNNGIEENGVMYYFDNLVQSDVTVDPCEGTQKIANLIDDFECQRNNAFGAGADQVKVVNNPKSTVENSSTKVGEYNDLPNEPWSALCAVFEEPIVLDAFNQLSIQVLSPLENVPFLLKLEGGTSPAKEIWTEIKVANNWYTASVDFSGEKGSNHKRVCFFFNGGVDNNPAAKFYIDNLQFAHAPYDGCVMNFDDPAFVSDSWRFFPADASGDFELIDNPDKSGINTSAKVGKAVEKASGEQPWQGMFTDLASYVKFGSDKLVKMKVWSPKVGAITMKLERPLKPGGAPNSGDNTIRNTKANAWEELTWDFSTTPIVDDGQYARVTLIWDIENVPTEDIVYYFDDIKLTGGNCGEEVDADDEFIEQLSISPNPVSNILSINHSSEISSFRIMDLYGRTVALLQNNYNNQQNIDVSSLHAGTYIIKSMSKNNKVSGIARFIKI